MLYSHSLSTFIHCELHVFNIQYNLYTGSTLGMNEEMRLSKNGERLRAKFTSAAAGQYKLHLLGSSRPPAPQEGFSSK